MLYKDSKDKELSPKLFRDPTNVYRGAPFWAWNCKLDQNELDRQVEDLKAMGFGGYHIHVRSGLATEYLSDEFFDLVRNTVKKGNKEGMLSWLYDEDRWPSGFAGGFVTRDEKYRARYLVMTPYPYSTPERPVTTSATLLRNEGGKLLARFNVRLDDNGCLQAYRILKENERATDDEWFAYLETESPHPWYNNQTYVNSLDKNAVNRFIELTHEKYRKKLGKSFGTDCPAIFTDEPQFTFKRRLNHAKDKEEIILPYTDDLEETYRIAYNGECLLANIPQLIWDLPNGKMSEVRYHYHDHICERFVQAFTDNIGTWCENNGIMLTGHMMDEPTLYSQTKALGEAMRCYRRFTLPGIDMLVDRHELNTAKQAQSAVHQYGREGMMSEEYGVTDWDFDFRHHKLQGDWQAALGVTLRVPHLSWVSMEGEAKRDYPASINYQSPWYKEYPFVENHFARVNTLMTRGKPLVRVAVIHPIESYWLHYGPQDRNQLILEEMETRFEKLTEWLLYGSIDFDFISEALLPELWKKSSRGPLRIGEMAYDTVIVPGCETLRGTTMNALEAFHRAGGHVIFLGKPAKYVNVRPSERPLNLWNSVEHIGFDRQEVLEALKADRLLTIRNADGSLTDNLVHQLRLDGRQINLFIANGKPVNNPDMSSTQEVEIILRGHYAVTKYDTLTGDIRPIPYEFAGESTLIKATLYAYDSLLLSFEPTEREYAVREDRKEKEKEVDKVTRFILPKNTGYQLDEQNVLLLDTAEYALDDGPWKREEEILRIDAACRKVLGWSFVGSDGYSAQPWSVKEDPISHRLHLRFRIESEIGVNHVCLAIEQADACKVQFNGADVDTSSTVGYFTDRSIRMVRLPPMKKGDNLLEVDLPFGKRIGAEWCYLIGDFGVRVFGKDKIIEKRHAKIAAADIVPQGLPFYSGKLTYDYLIKTRGGDVKVRVPHYRASTVTVSVDDKEAKPIPLAPYETVFSGLKEGQHVVHIHLYISRTNAFSPVHNANRAWPYVGPFSWRTEGDAWTYSYFLKEQGMLSDPQISEITYRPQG